MAEPTDIAAPPPGVVLAGGVARMLDAEGFAVLAEFPTPEGRRMDLCALGPRGEVWCIEVKSSRADFQADAKWERYLPWCERLFFAVPEGFPEALLPAEQGLIRADAWDAAVIRTPDVRAMAPARRRALTLSFARLAARRLWLAAPGTGATGYAPL
ncbi:MAG: MmcB family DNA repair protein [Pseudomonadota bacterium]